MLLKISCDYWSYYHNGKNVIEHIGRKNDSEKGIKLGTPELFNIKEIRTANYLVLK